MRKIAIIGAGQAGLQLAIGLLQNKYDVTLISEKSADEMLNGSILSSQCLFPKALSIERELGLNYWEAQCPKITKIQYALGDPATGKRLLA